MIPTHDSSVGFDGVQSYAHRNRMSDDVWLMAQSFERPMLNSCYALLLRISELSLIKWLESNKRQQNLMSAISFNMETHV